MKMTDPAGAHITRIYVNCPSRSSPSPIRSSNSPPVCTSTPITTNLPSNSCPKMKMALLAKEIIAAQRSSETFIQKAASPPAPQSPSPSPSPSSSPSSTVPEPTVVSATHHFPVSQRSPKEEYLFISKQTRQTIDFTTGEGLSKMLAATTDTIPKKKKKRQTIAVVPPTQDLARSSKSTDEGDNLVPFMSNIPAPPTKPKTNFTSYNGVQMFTFTLDDD